MDGTPAITIAKLSKRYRGSRSLALDRLSLEVNSGEVYGFLGANGAGKSTTIRTLANFIQPTSGSASILGHDIVTDSVAAKRHIGYLPGDVALYPKVTGKQFFAYMLELQPPKHKEYLAELVRRFDVDLHKPLDALSKGNRQKVGLLQAFVHEPEVLILDEPTSGLDPLMQEEFFKLIAECKQRGAAVFFSSHNLSEAQRICDRVGIIKEGKLIREQTIDDSSSLGQPIFRVTFAGDIPTRLDSVPQLKIISKADAYTVIIQPKGTIAEALAALSKYDIREFSSQKIDLENEFLEFYGDKS